MVRCYISDDRKADAIRLLQHGETQRSTASKLGMSTSTVKRTVRNVRENGRVSRPALHPGRRRLLSNRHALFLEACVERRPDSTIAELQDMLRVTFDIEASRQTVVRTLKRRGYTRKQISVPALEADEEKQAEYWVKVGTWYRPDQLVFLDESACNRFTTRRKYGWAFSGERARRSDYFIRGKRYSVLPALSLDGVLHVHVQDHSYTSAEFREFVDQLLDNMNPFPQKNSVVVMDNASIHRSQELQDMVEARGMHVLYLPAYSPQFNPIEEGFSAMKAWIRDNRDYCVLALEDHVDPAVADPYLMLYQAVAHSMTPDKAAGWFRHAGYIE